MIRVLAASLGTLLLAAPMSAHHSISATYDGERRITLQGVVTRIEWVNPHAYLFVDNTDSTGTVTNWAVEIGNPFDLESAGWTEGSLKVGEVVAVTGLPARGESKRAYGSSVVRVSNKQKLFAATGKPAPQAKAQPIPRWPDGQVRLGPRPGEKGFWGRASAIGLVENKAGEIKMNADAILLDLADADRVAPFRPWAKAVYEFRQRSLLVGDPLTRCLPPGGARQYQGAYGFQFVEQRELKRILVMLGGEDRNWHPIYMDGRKLNVEELAATPTYYGTSTGRWEKDTLVVETAGFNERFWFANGGLPHTTALRLTERFTRTDYNTLRYEVTVDDPRTYTRPWSGGWTIRWVPDREIEEYFCEENAETTFIR